MSEEYIRKLPFSLTTEQALLGSLIVNPDAITEVVEMISPTDFYLEDHMHIFSTVKDLFVINKKIDFVTLVDALVTKGVYDATGADEYIKSLIKSVPIALNVKDYARIIKGKSTLRKLIAACEDVSEKATARR